jgi:hypothetical protein
MALGVERDRPVLERARRAGRRRRARAPQQRAHARDELARAERLRHVVVRAELEPGDALRFLAARRQHDHGNRRSGGILAQRLTHEQAVHPRQHQIEQHQRRRRRLDLRERCGPRRCHVDGMSRFLQVVRDQIRDVLVVFDDEDVGHGE